MNALTCNHDEVSANHLAAELEQFREFGTATRILEQRFTLADGTEITVTIFSNEFWTAKQRQSNPLHEIAYRACFKAELPRFFIERLTKPGESVADFFMGRGTTLLESVLLGRVPIGNDISPLSAMLIAPRLNPPTIEQVKQRLSEIDFSLATETPKSLLAFYHPGTLLQICSLREYLMRRQAEGTFDAVDNWIRMVAINRLTGHSPGFFSVKTMPPNQAISVESQRKLNEQHNRVPPLRNVPALIVKKSTSLLKNCNAAVLQILRLAGFKARLFTDRADQIPGIPDSSVSLGVMSPPFLDTVDYAADNALRCWFAGIDPKSVQLTNCRKLEDWQTEMTKVFGELHRVLKPGGHIAFEVGEIRNGTVKLEAAVIPCGAAAGLEPVLVLINEQDFTKTANCWGVANNEKGTNTNRIVLFRKPSTG